MRKEEVKNILEKNKISRYKVFISFSSSDAKIATQLCGEIESMKINYWSMYDENGRDSNICGDNYRNIIRQELSKTCLFVILLSVNSIVSDEVYKELALCSDSQKMKNGHLRVCPIVLDDLTYEQIPDRIKELNIIQREMIVRHYDKDGNDCENAIQKIKNEISVQYYSVLMENISNQFELMKKSRKLTDLMKYCIAHKCYSRTVSDDIKSCDEVGSNNLREVHVLSNEILEYDCNTYSCMIISSNLLGLPVIDAENGTIEYNPAQNGVKYYYYCNANYIKEIKQAVLKKIESFIRKNKESRNEVLKLIRREFNQRNSVVDYFKSFDGLSKADFLEKYHIVLDKDIRAFENLVDSEEGRRYFAYADGDETEFQVPPAIIDWLQGNKKTNTGSIYTYEAYDFIAFVDKFVNLLKDVKEANSVLLDELKRYNIYLQRLQQLEKWQHGEIKINNSDSTRLVTYLLDYSANKNKDKRRFPKLERWMQYNYDKNGKEITVSENAVQSALNNIVFLPITNDTSVELCYSFALFINEDSASASWYSTGLCGDNQESSNMVIVYDAVNELNEYKRFSDCFVYLAEIEPEIKNQLTRTKSRLWNNLT